MEQRLSFWEHWLTSRAYWRVLGYGAALAVVCLACLYIAQLSYFDWRRVTISGDVSRVSLQAIKNQTRADLDGNFWNIDLRGMQKRLEQVPWVQRAVVHRQFPDTLRVQIEEQVPAAIWQSDTANAFVNGFGEVFEADASEVGEDLPVFIGQEEQSARMMSMYVALQREVNEYGVQIQEIELSRGGSWSVLLSTGCRLMLGQGGDRELQARLQRFFSALNEISPEKPAKEALVMIALADLRYQNGFSVRLRSNLEGGKVE